MFPDRFQAQLSAKILSETVGPASAPSLEPRSFCKLACRRVGGKPSWGMRRVVNKSAKTVHTWEEGRTEAQARQRVGSARSSPFCCQLHCSLLGDPQKLEDRAMLALPVLPTSVGISVKNHGSLFHGGLPFPHLWTG